MSHNRIALSIFEFSPKKNSTELLFSMDSLSIQAPELPSPSISAYLVYSRKGIHILKDLQHHKTFIEWAIKILYAEAHKPSEHPKWMLTIQKAKLWSAYSQCAENNSGKPSIECHRCLSILEPS